MKPEREPDAPRTRGARAVRRERGELRLLSERLLPPARRFRPETLGYPVQPERSQTVRIALRILPRFGAW